MRESKLIYAYTYTYVYVASCLEVIQNFVFHFHIHKTICMQPATFFICLNYKCYLYSSTNELS